jgi:hypothetical protein
MAREFWTENIALRPLSQRPSSRQINPKMVSLVFLHP